MWWGFSLELIETMKSRRVVHPKWSFKRVRQWVFILSFSFLFNYKSSALFSSNLRTSLVQYHRVGNPHRPKTCPSCQQGALWSSEGAGLWSPRTVQTDRLSWIGEGSPARRMGPRRQKELLSTWPLHPKPKGNASGITSLVKKQVYTQNEFQLWFLLKSPYFF